MEKTNPLNFKGYITEIVGLIIKAQGPKASVGELCYILNDDNKIPCEVMGFKDKEILLMPLDNLDGIRPGSEVVATGNLSK